MEPELLVPFGYKIEDSEGVRDKLTSIGIASIGIASLLSGREPGQLAASFLFIIAAGSAPMRVAAATMTGQEVTITTTTINDYSYYIDCDLVTMIGSILLVSNTTIVIAMWTSRGLHQQLRKPQMIDASTQTDQGDATRVAGSREVVQCRDRGKVTTTEVHQMLTILLSVWLRLTATPSHCLCTKLVYWKPLLLAQVKK
eukprot:5037932-Amphidinium_carterae.1